MKLVFGQEIAWHRGGGEKGKGRKRGGFFGGVIRRVEMAAAAVGKKRKKGACEGRKKNWGKGGREKGL